jgi:hypothetical protein
MEKVSLLRGLAAAYDNDLWTRLQAVDRNYSSAVPVRSVGVIIDISMS